MEKQDRDNAGKFTPGSEAARRAGQKGGKAGNSNRDRVDIEREANQKSDNKSW